MNRTLAIFARPIPYHKELRKIAGSATSAILLTQLDYWFSKKPDGFHKFLEPCNRPGYKEGDSWSEELGFSAKEFRTAFKSIGIAYKSKGEYDQAADKFGGLFYCSYHNRVTGQTWYYRNHKVLDEAIETLANQGSVTGTDQRAFTGKSDPDSASGAVTDQRAFTDHSVTDQPAVTVASVPDFTSGVVTDQPAVTQLTNGQLDHAETTPETTSSESTDREKNCFSQVEFAHAQPQPEPHTETLVTPTPTPTTLVVQSSGSARTRVPGGSENDSQSLTIGAVTYRQSPASIDLSEAWERDKMAASLEARSLAPGHKSPWLVAHGLGAVWVGPGKTDFNADLLSLIARYKRDEWRQD
ncbi:MAG: hypothetical protein AAFW75_33570, partial [Cyanobacteria bacterium J06636_16]